ncbi:hypothetical protein D3C72_1185850 [compost metagenome]
MEVAVELSAKLLNEDSGTICARVVDRAEPLDGSRAAVVFDGAALVVAAVAVVPLAATAAAFDAGTYTERSASGLCA